MTCRHIEPMLTSYLEGPGELSAGHFAAVSRHLGQCRACSTQLEELRWVVTALKAQPRPEAPFDLAAALHRRLATEGSPVRQGLLARALAAFNWPSLAAGAVLAAAVIAVVLHVAQPPVGIQVAAVPEDRNVGLQIAFDVGHDVKDVTFDIKLSDGLRFIDAKGQPVDTQEVHWTGELLQGKTVVPVTVRGVRPGRWEILAVVRKDRLARSTRIIVPVLADKPGVAQGGEG